MKKKKTKRTYRLRNWKQYNSALVQRGSLTLWVSDDILAQWRNHDKSKKRGKPRYYSDTAIFCMASLEEVFHLPLPATEGLMQSIIKLLALDLTAPDYTTLCRRRKHLEVVLPRRTSNGPLHMVVDSTGIKVFGEGEWKVRQHGYTKRRTWRKLHIGADEATGEIVAAVVTTNNFADSQVLSDLLEQVEDEIEQVSGDGSYDKRSCYEAIGHRQAKAAIPPRKDARIWQHGNSKQQRLIRDENLRRIRQVGRRQWKKEVGYHRRSLAETQMFRVKTIFGDRVSARQFGGQATQVLVRCAALNKMTHLGMPDSYAV
ncbi:MAG TPA: IS5 family transposase [Gammaproteobacteria bacterium]|nr:IS5 family transposase [Gammaproteobacteria bacterium]